MNGKNFLPHQLSGILINTWIAYHKNNNKEKSEMCGIAGVINRKKTVNVGEQMRLMLQGIKHRGPDSTGYAMYGTPLKTGFILRFKVSENSAEKNGSSKAESPSVLMDRKKQVDVILKKHGAKITKQSSSTPYAFRYEFTYKSDDLEALAKEIETVETTEILSIGKGLELIKDLGDATKVADQYGLNKFMGTHGIGHTRMATESDVDIKSAHPYWAFPYQDVAVVHNGQLTNYWGNRRVLERNGYRFNSNCDSEIIAVYIADKMSKGIDLEKAMNDSLDELDGVFTYIVSTKNQLGMAKDHMAAKPMVIYESEDIVACASEEVAIRNIFPHEIVTYDPYEAEVKVWQV
jgi:glutamate synthase domain-containing protein 1